MCGDAQQAKQQEFWDSLVVQNAMLRTSFKIPEIQHYLNTLKRERTTFDSLSELNLDFIPKMDQLHRGFLDKLGPGEQPVRRRSQMYKIQVNPAYLNLQCTHPGCRFRFYFKFIQEEITVKDKNGNTTKKTQVKFFVPQVHQWHSYPLH